jgi:hypothetical protein
VRDFLVALAKAEKGIKEIKILIGQAYSNKSLKKTQIYQFIKEVKEAKKALFSDIPNLKK